MAIKILSETVTSQIAAGEVVERPASVVKELVENALDASAASIDVQVEIAGKKLIAVSDDGVGIPFNEVKLAVARHATSKLQSAEDLGHIRTLGFRGEALASVASVSILTIQSKTADSKVGGSITVKGGQVGKVHEIGMSQGTHVQVQELFYNTPARLKFLKQDLTEKNQIIALVSRYAIEYGNVRFTLKLESKSVFQTFGKNDRREILTQLYGVEIGRQLLEVDLDDGDIQVKGYVSPIALTRSNRKEMVFFVNGRLIQDTALNTAFLQAYHSLLMVGRYPMGFLSIHLQPEDIDVNVHPSKAEIRFKDSNRIFSCVQRAIKRVLLNGGVELPSLHIGWTHFENRTNYQSEPASFSTFKSPPAPDASEKTSSEPLKPILQQTPLANMPLLRTIGQIGLAYIVAEGPDGLYLIDQHAAHERVLYEKITSQTITKSTSQALLEPRVIHLQARTASILTEQLAVLRSMGFEIEEFGENTFRVLSIPNILAGQDEEQLIRSALEQAEEDETPFQDQLNLKLIARICKRAAIKSGKVLSMEEARNLVQDLEKCHSPRTCPHGRPTMIHLSVDLLERQFGRRGAR